VATVSVNVLGTWSLTPDTADFGDVVVDADDDVPAQRVLFQSDVNELLGVHCADAPWLRYQVVQRPVGREIEIHVDKSILPLGWVSTSLVITSSSEVKPTGVVYVKAKGIHQLTAVPGSLALASGESQRVEFRDTAGQLVKVVSATSRLAGLLLEVLPDGTVEVTNGTKGARAETARVEVVDDRGRRGTVLVGLM
jgi:hypothetical protein